MPQPDAKTARATEHRADRSTGSAWDEGSADFVDYDGIFLWWRFVGEKSWRKHTLVPKGDQTVDGLLAKVDEIVARMAAKHLAAVADYGTLGELRELTADLPDDTLIEVDIRKAHDPDHFYEPVLAEGCLSIHTTNGRLVVNLAVPEPRDLGA